MTSRAERIARRACARYGSLLRPEDWEEITADAELAAWQDSRGTHIWWAALDSVDRILRPRRTTRPKAIVSLDADDGPGAWAAQHLASSESPEEDAVSNVYVAELLSRLPASEAQAVELIVLQGMTKESAGVALGIHPSNIGRRVQRGLGRLRDQVAL